jgi:hypothetical protein
MKQYKDTPYYISEDGKIFRDGKEKNTTMSNKGYKMVSTYFYGKSNKLYIHRLVAICYVPNPNNKQQVNHIDGDKLNNHYTNLEWVTNQENRNHAIKNKLHCVGIDVPNSKLTEDDVLWIRKNYIKSHRKFGGNALALKFNVSGSCILQVVTNKQWKHLSLRHSR